MEYLAEKDSLQPEEGAWSGTWITGACVAELLATLRELEHLGVDFVSLTRLLI
jgi:hypothetical protein